MSFSRAFAEGNNEFALDLFRASFEERRNLFFSPFSLRTVLGMTCLGAKGETAAQMNEVLGLSSMSETNQLAIADMIQRLNSSDGEEYEIAVAHSLWGQMGSRVLPEFLEQADRIYGASLSLVDFRNDSEAARAAINRWVAEKTREKIRGVVPSGSLNPDTGLILVNAVYFKGSWKEPFQPDATESDSFYLDEGGEVVARLMHREMRVRYARADGFQVIDLDYLADAMSMLVILPDKTNGLRELETRLSASVLRGCVSRMEGRKVDIFLPKFEMTWSGGRFPAWLTALGMPLAFDRAHADFSGINGVEPPDKNAFVISDVFQTALVEVNEEGTEAAAASIARCLGESMGQPPPVPLFRADHPFLFAIVDRYSDSILFLGRVSDPTAAN